MDVNLKIALIPARGGSKRLLRKNIISFCGRPMLEWTVEAARTANVFDDVVVSTEDSEIESVGRACGASVLRRPLCISNDNATLIEVVHHAIDSLPEVSDICILLPNCPLRPASEIIRSEQEWYRLESPALISVVDYLWTPPFRAQKIDIEKRLSPLIPELYCRKSQCYPEVVCPSGAIYWSRSFVLRSASNLYVSDIRGFRMPWYLAIDIDTLEDIHLAKMVRFALDHGFVFEK